MSDKATSDVVVVDVSAFRDPSGDDREAMQKALDYANAISSLRAENASLREALQRCLAYIERDELAHGRQFGEGNEARAALAKASGASQ